MYMDAEVFESVNESDRGERSVEEAEKRLMLFAEQVTKSGLGDGKKLRLQQSKQAMETFLELNLFILNIKKVRSVVLCFQADPLMRHLVPSCQR